MFKRQSLIVFGLIFLLAASSAMADWVEADGHKMHWPQLPDVTGWDVNATYPASVLADDFTCGQTGPITDIHFWGSWKHDDIGLVTGFWLSIHEDIPDPDGDGPLYSMPGVTLWDGLIEDFVVATPVDPPGVEGWYDPITGEVIPSDHQSYFQYNVFLPEPQWIQQVEGRIYWLNISAVVADPEFTQWGVKTTLVDLNHMDDAVYTPAGSLEWMEMYHPTSSGFPYVPGDVDGSGVVDMNDVLFLETFMGAGSPAPPYFIPGTNPRFYPAADVDGDCQSGTLADMNALIAVVQGVGTASYCPNYPPMVTAWGPSLDLAFVITGPDPVGACCYDDGSCTNGMTAADCVSSGGDYGGDGSSCSWDGNANGVDDFCEGVVLMGACCYGDPVAPTCVNTTQTVCGQSYNGTWYVGQDCASFTCPTVATGACCYDDGSCVNAMTAADCVSSGGDYGGDGSSCSWDGNANGVDDFCEGVVLMGACCYGDPVAPTCVNTTQTVCGQSYNGTWYVGQDCASFTCPTVATGACCYDDGSCVNAMTAADCATSGGQYAGDGQTCAGDNNFNGVDDNCEGVVTMGACCYLEQVTGTYSCINTTQTYCGQTLNGDWYAGQDCATYQCAYPGACCFEDPALGWVCAMTDTQGDCDALGGTWYEGVPCAAIYCTPPTGACCYGDPLAPDCANTTEVECTQTYGGTWHAGEDCATFTCPGGTELELKWLQPPDLSPAGMDVNATFMPPIIQYVLATDFECTSTGAILEVHVFGSWLHDYLPFGDNPYGVSFNLSIHADIPDSDGDGPAYSMPGEMICFYQDWTDYEVVQYATGLQEGWLNPPNDYDPNGDEVCWEYIFTLPGDCIQEGTAANPIVYWLDVQAFPYEGNALWGWKTAEPPHWNDDAVWAIGIDDPAGSPNWNELITPGGGYAYLPGDVDDDGDVDIIDLDYLQAYIFTQGPPPVYSVPGTNPPFYAAADCNGDCSPNIDMADFTALTSALSGGPAPAYCAQYPPGEAGVSLDLAFAIYGEASTDTCAGQLPGDFDSDGFPATAADLAALTAHVLGGGPAAVPASNGDFNGDCRVNQWDIDDMTSYIATGLPAPADCTCLNPYGPCCIGVVGNVNLDPLEQVTIGDIAILTNHLFIDRPLLECVTESDVNQSGGPNPSQINPGSDITIGDIAILTDYLFITGPQLYGPLLDCF